MGFSKGSYQDTDRNLSVPEKVPSNTEIVEGDRGAGARENRGRERAGSGSKNKESDSLLFTSGYYSVKNTFLTKF